MGARQPFHGRSNWGLIEFNNASKAARPRRIAISTGQDHSMMQIAPAFEFDGPGGNLAEAARRSELTRALYDRFQFWTPLRDALQNNTPLDRRRLDRMEDILSLAMRDGGLQVARSGHVRVSGHARQYFLGGWLEEFMALALNEAGCDRIRFSQRVTWRAGTDGSQHANEIDAVAHWQKRLVLVSCKAAAYDTLKRKTGEDRLFSALLELSYWNAHFGRGEALPILVTTADFYNEAERRFRSPKLVERARVLELAVISADFSNWQAFQARLSSLLESTVSAP